MTTEGTRMVGASVRRKEDQRLIQGLGVYTGDVPMPNALTMAVLRSPHAHARITTVDTAAAQQLPGVAAVYAGAEVNAMCRGEFRLSGVRDHMKPVSRWAMAVDTVKYEGEPVVVVLARDQYVAQDALDLVSVEYRPLPAVVDLERALDPDSPLVHEELGTNECGQSSRTSGDPNSAFAEANGVVSLRVTEPRLVPNAMEPRAVLASYQPGLQELTLWISTQAPHMERGFVAHTLGFPENRLRVISKDVGGGFGAKIDTYPETVIAAALAIEVGRPIRWTEDRQEEFTSTIHGRGEVQYVEGAYTNEGILTALRFRFYTDLGAYCFGGTHAVAETLTPSGSTGAYQVSHLEWTAHGVYTNKMSVGPYRGYGQHATAYVVELVMDRIAVALSLDPAEVRRRNLIPQGLFPYRTPTGREHDSGEYQTALDRALELADYAKLREEQRSGREEGTLLGIGLATTVDASGFGPSGAFSVRPGFETATVRVDATGRATVITGSSPHGQGHETTFAQIASDQLSIPLEEIDVVYGDTALISQGTGTRASRSVVVGGTAVVQASRQVKEKATLLAASMLRTEPEHVGLEGGRFFAEDIPDRYVTWPDIASLAFGAQSVPEGVERGLEANVFWEPAGYTFPFSANVAIVRVDSDNGVVTLTDFISVDDFGTVVNPMVVDGQVHGGLAQGIGAALWEEAVWDQDGQLLTGSFMDYAMPLANRLPDFTVEQMGTPSPHNPLGTKGMGESPTIAAVPAVVNAVVDALSHLGVTHLDIPLTAERVWRAVREATE